MEKKNIIMIALSLLFIASLLFGEEKLTKNRDKIEIDNKDEINWEKKNNFIIHQQKKDAKREDNKNIQTSTNIEIFRFSFFGK